MPEGDTLFRTAQVLRRTLLGEEILEARSLPGGARLDLVVGSRVAEVRSQGKHLLIGFDAGLTLHTHLGMHGSWHRYGVAERWRRPPDAAVAILRTHRSVAVCFDAPVVELVDSRALGIHPALSRLGPDLLAAQPDIAAATARLQAPERGGISVAEALLDQSAVAGIGNVYRSEVLFLARLDPFRAMATLPADTIESLLRSAAALLGANTAGGARTTRSPTGAGTLGSARVPTSDRHWVYRRSGRPCRRCGALVRSTVLGSLPRRLYWCPVCQTGTNAMTQEGRAAAGDR